MSTKLNNIFQILPELPKPLAPSHCILFKDELLIYGGYTTNDCYSYHTLKKQYKYICSYPNDIQMDGHCVVQLIHSQTNSNEIHLLSFGGQGGNKMKQTFSMKYKSVWEISESKSEHQSFNTWIRHNQDTNIGKLEDHLQGVRGLIGGINNDLLFITHHPKNIKVIDLKTMKALAGIKNNTIPKENDIFYHCFVPLTMNNRKLINHFILFCRNTGLLIKYDERNKTFHYEKLPICPALNGSYSYSFVYLYDFIFLFGGFNGNTWQKVKSVYKYSMKEKIWTECKFTLPMAISQSFAILSDDNKNVHVIGGRNAKYEIQKMHVNVNVEQLFEKSELLKMVKMYENSRGMEKVENTNTKIGKQIERMG
ncbi:hypothetical protein RFI_37096 [Reticulomyxa filosa]|uniref:Kelch motif family protein n=1 Tax=Reticulomyxa filosa TaxID=46433 RepID=X6LG67_RETFI|nr:hypothetical protein RFI_37096 [Reticulomyxa filosa]|eukprot:ETO00351.1 hypothetical protein RFI_37096 [Reticulomyxa filosa]